MKHRELATLRKVIVSMLSERDAVKDFKADKRVVITAGPPGAGKSTISKLILGGLGFVDRDVDDMLVSLLKKEKLDLDMEKHSSEDKKKTDELRNKTFSWIEKSQESDIKKGRGFIINTTGANYAWTVDLAKKLEEAGYQVKMLLVYCSLETALKRNRSRSRSVPEEVVKQKHSQVENNIEKYRAKFGGDFHYYNSDEGKPAPTDPMIVKISKDIHNWRPSRQS